ARHPAPARPRADGGGEHRHRGRGAAPPGSVRGVSLRDRAGEEAAADLEEGAAHRRHRPVGGPGGTARGRGTGGDAVIPDRLSRPLGSLRVSVTDRCNLRCRYCMPEEEYVWLPKSSLLTFEEIARLTGVFAELGVTKVRLTGGEPLLRHELPNLVSMLRADRRLADPALTTNGVLLGRFAADLKAAGLGRVTVSLDTLRPDRMQDFARSSLTADGTWFLCLYAAKGVDLRAPLRAGASDAELSALIRETWQGRTDRGAEERLGVRAREVLYPVAALRADPHREMHTRGG